MNTAQPNLLQLAKQGDAKAIATLLNRSLQPKGITARANLKSSCLHVVLEAVKAPEQKALVAFLHKGLSNLSCQTIQRVKVYGKQTGEDFPIWTQNLELCEQPSLESPLIKEKSSDSPVLISKSNFERQSNLDDSVSSIYESQQEVPLQESNQLGFEESFIQAVKQEKRESHSTTNNSTIPAWVLLVAALGSILILWKFFALTLFVGGLALSIFIISELKTSKTVKQLFMVIFAFSYVFIWVGFRDGSFSSKPKNLDVSAIHSASVSSTLFGSEWMLTVESGTLSCESPSVIVFVDSSGTKYAVNGAAMSKGYQDIRAIWKDNPQIAGAKMSISPLLSKGLSLCE